MRYAPPGLCVNDFAVLAHADGYTVLHLQGPWTDDFDHLRMETSFGRATSPDLVDWTPQGSVFGTGLPGRFDDQAVWTMHPIPYRDGLAMFYTGVSGLTPDGWPLQSVGLALSDRTDGTAWRRYGHGPVTRADPRWYRTGEGMGWRDPFVVRDDDDTGWVMVVCASDASLPVERSGCVGLATSTDLTHWQVRPPLLSPGDIDELECPVLERLDDGWLLLGCVGSARSFEAWTSPRLDGPWKRHGPLGPAGAYAPRVVRARGGERVALHTTPRRAGLTDSGAWCRGMLAQPKALVTPAGGAPRLEWWTGLDHWLGEPTAAPEPHAVGDVPVNGRARIAVRGGPRGAALTVGYDTGRVHVTGQDGHVLQEASIAAPVRSLRILTIGEYVEVYADGVFVLTTASYSGHSVPWTVTTTSGARSVPVRPVRLPGPYRDDASAIWPGPGR